MRCGEGGFLARGRPIETGRANLRASKNSSRGLNVMALGLILLSGLLSLVYGGYTASNLMSASAGSERMQEISGAVAEGAQAYLRRQYITIGIVGVVVFIALGLLLSLSGPQPTTDPSTTETRRRERTISCVFCGFGAKGRKS